MCLKKFEIIAQRIMDYIGDFLSTPGLCWNAMSKITKIELEPIPDPDMYIFLEKGTGGRISIDTAKSTINI